MSSPNLSASHDFLFSRLHGMWTVAAKGEKLQTLAMAGTPERLAHLLKEFGITDISSRAAFHRQLLQHQNNVLQKICQLLDSPLAKFYHSFAKRTYYENLKTIIHSRYCPDKTADISASLIELKGFPAINVKKALEAESPYEFLVCLNLRDGDEELLDQLIRLEKDRDITAADSAIEKMAYHSILQAADALPSNLRNLAHGIIGAELDIINLCIILRNTATYHMPTKKTLSMLPAHGELLDEKLLTKLAEEATIQGIQSKLPAHYRKVLLPFAQNALYQWEHALWKDLYGRVTNTFINFSEPSSSIIAFPFLKRFETLNISRIYEGIHFGMPPRDMLDMIIG